MSRTLPTPAATTFQWRPLPLCWICLNNDGSVCPSMHYAIAGGSFRDNNGFWIQGFDAHQSSSPLIRSIHSLRHVHEMLNLSGFPVKLIEQHIV
ncbi:hypothetical protein V6N13_126910 [Hibiscus sabdariffa]